MWDTEPLRVTGQRPPWLFLGEPSSCSWMHRSVHGGEAHGIAGETTSRTPTPKADRLGAHPHWLPIASCSYAAWREPGMAQELGPHRDFLASV